MQRLTWDLRYPAANLSAPPPPDADPDFEPPSGPLVMPGTYKATVSKRVDGVMTQLGQPQEFQMVVEGQESMSVTDRTALVEFQQKAVRLQRAVSGATQAANALRPRLTAIKRAISETPSLPHRLYEDAMAVEKRNNESHSRAFGRFGGPATQHEHAAVDQRSRRLRRWARNACLLRVRRRRSRINTTVAAQDFETVLAQLRQLIEVDVARLEKQLEAAGAPWTPGRIPEWRDQ